MICDLVTKPYELPHMYNCPLINTCWARMPRAVFDEGIEKTLAK